MEEIAEGSLRIGAWLTVLFVVLKLLDKIYWSWWWVFSPLWIPIGLIIAVFLFLWVLIKVSDFSSYGQSNT